MKVADPTNTQFDGQPSPVPIAKPTNVPASPTPTPLPLAGSPQVSTGAQALPGGIPQVNSPVPATLGSPTMPGDQRNAQDAERAYQQATNPAVGGNDANIPAAAQVYQQTIDPTQSYVPTQQVQDTQAIQQTQGGDPTVTGSPAQQALTPQPLPLAPPADATPSMPTPITPSVQATDVGGQAAPMPVANNPLPLAPSAPVDATPSIPAPSALDPAPAPVVPPVSPISAAMDSAPIPLATSTLPSGVPISNQDLTGATISGAPTPAPIAPTAQTNFANDLTGKTLGVGQTPDRLALAQSMFDTFQKQSDPAYQAAVREAESNGAALGQLGSGGLRTSVGNLAAQRNLALEGERQNLTNSALEGSIGDAYKNVGIDQQQQGFQAGQKDAAFGQAAQQQGVQNATNQFNTGVAQQQQGFQTGQQGTAFNQAAQQAQIQEALTNGDFNRALTLFNAGNQNSPNLALAADYTGQAGQAGQAAGSLIQNAVGNANTQIPAWLLPYLQQQGGTPNANIPLAIPNPTGTPVSQPQVG